MDSFDPDAIRNPKRSLAKRMASVDGPEDAASAPPAKAGDMSQAQFSGYSMTPAQKKAKADKLAEMLRNRQ
jgi:hypothetical protein